MLYCNTGRAGIVKEPKQREVLCACRDTAEPVTSPKPAISPVNRTDRDRPARLDITPWQRSDDGAWPDRAPTLTGRDRPAPPRPHMERRLQLGLILSISLLVHSAIFAFFRAGPEMMASVGEDTITVEIVVGANAAAGIAEARSDTEAERQTAADMREVATQQRPIKAEVTPPPETAMAQTPEPVRPIVREAIPPEQNTEEKLPEPRPPESSPRERSTASAPANSIGRGRMAGDANYQGLVAARLARFKRFPPEARRRREQGSALVSFTIDSTGRETSVRLIRGTGFAALDEEVEAMVRRASPFPPPPREITFSAPVSFHLN